MENNFKEIDSKKLAVGISSGISIVCGVGAGIGAANNLRLWTTPGAGEHLITRDIFIAGSENIQVSLIESKVVAN